MKKQTLFMLVTKIYDSQHTIREPLSMRILLIPFCFMSSSQLFLPNPLTFNTFWEHLNSIHTRGFVSQNESLMSICERVNVIQYNALISVQAGVLNIQYIATLTETKTPVCLWEQWIYPQLTFHSNSNCRLFSQKQYS